MKLPRVLRSVFWALLFCFAMGTACAQPSIPPLASKNPLLTPIADQLQSLITGSAPAITPPPSAGPTAPPPAEEPTEPLETFGTRALNLIISSFELIRTQASTFVSNFSALAQLSSWFVQQQTNPHLQIQWNTIGNDLLVIVGIPFSAALVFELLLYPLRSRLRRAVPNNYASKLLNLLGMLLLVLLPIVLFIAASLILLDQTDIQKLPRYVILNFVYALTLGRLSMVLTRALLAPRAPALRLIPATSETAHYACRWISAFSLILIGGYFFIDLARTVRAPNDAITAFGNLLGLTLVLMAMIVIVQKRALVSVLLRGDLSAVNRDLTFWQGLRLWFARHWHTLAVAYLVIGYGIAVLGVEKGLARMLRGTVLTLLVFVSMRILFDAIDRWSAHAPQKSSNHLRFIFRYTFHVGVWIGAALAALAAWGVDLAALFVTPLGQRLTGAAFSIGSTLLIVSFLYEAIHAAIERNVNARDSEGKIVEVSGRMRTLAPMLRHATLIVLGAIVIIVILSEAGINIGPLLAGAGIAGVAVGFGSQALVKDFLTGFFIVVENTIAIGDNIQIGTHTGTVENISIRTLRLRDADGALHILPFSEVTKIVNTSKDYSFATIDIGVAYDSDLDKVMNVLRSVGEELQNDPIFKRVILEPFEILGIESFGEFSITLRSRVRTRPNKQADVKRMYLLKVKQRFDKEGITIPVRGYFMEPKTPLA